MKFVSDFVATISEGYDHHDDVERLGRLAHTANRYHGFHEELKRDGSIHLYHGYHPDTPELRAHIEKMKKKGWRADGTDKGLSLEPPK